jgi:hypothetical protein
MLYENVVKDFAKRTRKNMEAIENYQTTGAEVFEATQLINSMLGLLVFPQQKYVASIPQTPLDELERDGWPVPKVRGSFKQVTDLNQLIRYLRNAITHFNIEFIGDGQNQIAMLKVWNMAPVRKNGKALRKADGSPVEKKNWEAELSLNDLRKLADRFIDMLLEHNAAT